jgi:exosortase
LNIGTAGALSRADTALARSRSRETVAVLLLGLGVLALLFHAEIAAAISVWLGSTAYNHWFVVLPLAAFLAWERRGRLAGMPVQPAPWAALAALPLTAVWLAAERLGIMEGRQLAAIGMLELLFLAVLGWRMWRAMAAPLLYFVFLVPFGEFLVPALQRFTWRFAVAGLDLLGIPNFASGDTIEIR